jgi:hypothetical protein
MKINETNDYLLAQKQMVRINQSQAFCFVAFLISALPVVWLVMFSDSYEISSILDRTKVPTLFWLMVVPTLYLWLFSLFSVYNSFGFRVVSKRPVAFSLSLYKLFATLFVYNDFVLHTAWLSIRRVWTLEERLKFVHNFLSDVPNGSLVDQLTISDIAAKYTSISDLKIAAHSAIDAAMNPSWYDYMARLVINHGSEILLYVVCAGATFLAIKLVAGYLSEQNRSLGQISASLDEIQDEVSVLRDEVDEIRNNRAVVVGEIDHHVVQVGQAIDLLANGATLSTMQSNSLVRLMNDHFADFL